MHAAFLPMACSGVWRLAGSLIKKAQATCDGMNFHLWNADMNEELRSNSPKSGERVCAEDFEFSISAHAGNCSSVVQSARLIMGGKIRVNKKENVEPYMLFGDDMKSGTTYEPFKYQGNTNGRDMELGNYTVTAKFFRNDNARWFLDQISANFTMAKC
jgi:hypothetical protein